MVIGRGDVQQGAPINKRLHVHNIVGGWRNIRQNPGGMNALHPKKLLLTKWTAVKPIAKNKHFLVANVTEPKLPETALVWIDLEAVYSKKQIRIEWRDLRDVSQWKQGWV